MKATYHFRTLRPLLQSYLASGPPTIAELRELPVLGSRFKAILEAGESFLNQRFTEQASAAEWRAALTMFYERCISPPLFVEVVEKRAEFLRHTICHLLHSPDPIAEKFSRLVPPSGTYFIAGLGMDFWSSILQAIEPASTPGFTRGVLGGLTRLTLLSKCDANSPADQYRSVQLIYHQLQGEYPSLSALHLDHFFTLISCMKGRDLWSSVKQLRSSVDGVDIAEQIRILRASYPLRRRIREKGKFLQRLRMQWQGSTSGSIDYKALCQSLGEYIAECDLQIPAEAEEKLFQTFRSIFTAADPTALLADASQALASMGADPWLVTALLHLCDPEKYFLCSHSLIKGFETLNHGSLQVQPLVEQYALYNLGLAALCKQYGLHYLEVPSLLKQIAPLSKVIHAVGEDSGKESNFHGFTRDAFVFFHDLGLHNDRMWMNGQRERYRYFVRGPLQELCRALASKYVEPVLIRNYDLPLETSPTKGGSISSICKNDYGRTEPYQSELTIAFYPKLQPKKLSPQLFVQLDAEGLRFGVRIGRHAKDAGRSFRRSVQEHADAMHAALARTGALNHCLFIANEDWKRPLQITQSADLRLWLKGKSLAAGQFLEFDHPLIRSEALVGEIILAFNRVLPIFLCAIEQSREPSQSKWFAIGQERRPFTTEHFQRETLLSDDWLRTARTLLEIKRQLILQGVPGTGKTYVARMLARWITAGDESAIKLVQFHPTYSYEEFVEGIKARSVDANGQRELSYPVEEGILGEISAVATQSYSRPFVLIIDEINRGNLPRIFGELLYLLEYRDQSIILPYSRRAFKIPPNLYVIGTMNSADRSVTTVDQALKRRFSFLPMQPSGELLKQWFQLHPPLGGERFANAVVQLFDELNRRLARDAYPDCKIGHTYFMVHDLSPEKLEAIWKHQVLPVVDHYLGSHKDRVEHYCLDRLMASQFRDSAKSQSEQTMHMKN